MITRLNACVEFLLFLIFACSIMKTLHLPLIAFMQLFDCGACGDHDYLASAYEPLLCRLRKDTPYYRI